MTTMTPTQVKALEALVKWQEETFKGTPEHWRAMIAGTMLTTLIPLSNGQLEQIDEIINY